MWSGSLWVCFRPFLLQCWVGRHNENRCTAQHYTISFLCFWARCRRHPSSAGSNALAEHLPSPLLRLSPAATLSPPPRSPLHSRLMGLHCPSSAQHNTPCPSLLAVDLLEPAHCFQDVLPAVQHNSATETACWLPPGTHRCRRPHTNACALRPHSPAAKGACAHEALACRSKAAAWCGHDVALLQDLCKHIPAGLAREAHPHVGGILTTCAATRPHSTQLIRQSHQGRPRRTPVCRSDRWGMGCCQ